MTTQAERLSTALTGRYTIQRELGSGGMATVYLAHDLRHDRNVALKVLRPELAAVIGADRFLAEIKTTASLQHPHILPLFDSGEADSFLFYVMPQVQGETLREKLSREKQLSVDEALGIARAVASALDYAHRHNVVHRDIKPENILLHEGQAMVADFGIALAIRTASGNRLTETGLSLGTPHYMSPEQAMGERDITAKSDIYALGCVLYEMLAGEPPFTGPTAQAIVSKVMTDTPRALTLQRTTVPPHVDAAVRMALQKLPADRFATAAQFAEALARPGLANTEDHAVLPAATKAARSPIGSGNRRLQVISAVAALAVIAALWGWLRPAPRAELSRFSIAMPKTEEVVPAPAGTSLAVSPDGRRVVYIGANGQLRVREFGRLDSRPLPGTEGARDPFFSPDGEWVGFEADSKLKKVALSGGPPLTIIEVQSNLRGAAWWPGDIVVFTPNATSGLYRVSAAGGSATAITTLDTATKEVSHRWPDVLPDGNGVVFTTYTGTAEDAYLSVYSFRTGKTTRLPAKGFRPQYAKTGQLVYASVDGALVALPFDAGKLEVTGAPVSILEGVMTRPDIANADYSLSPAGTLVYLSGLPPERSLALVDRKGVEQALTDKLRIPEGVRFSPDGRRIALALSTSGSPEVWIYDLAARTTTRMTFEGQSRYPAWAPDGARIAYSTTTKDSPKRSIFWRRADGTGSAELLHRGDGEQFETAWLPDARSLIVRQTTSGPTSNDIMLVSLRDTSAAVPLLQTTFNERGIALSPDGRWLAYTSNESGRDEIYVRPVQGEGGKRQVSTAGGTEPLWARDQRELYFRDGRRFIAVPVRTTPTFSMGPPQGLFEDKYVGNANHANYDVNPRDGRFVMIKGAEQPTELVVVLNWFEELQQRMAKK
jgi:serine/threonine-protein kinase